MRISDWSSDVCSSDLDGAWRAQQRTLYARAAFRRRSGALRRRGSSKRPLGRVRRTRRRAPAGPRLAATPRMAFSLGGPGSGEAGMSLSSTDHSYLDNVSPDQLAALIFELALSSEERRLGKECVSTCIFWLAT